MKYMTLIRCNIPNCVLVIKVFRGDKPAYNRALLLGVCHCPHDEASVVVNQGWSCDSINLDPACASSQEPCCPCDYHTPPACVEQASSDIKELRSSESFP